MSSLSSELKAKEIFNQFATEGANEEKSLLYLISSMFYPHLLLISLNKHFHFYI